jgi:predicted nicotinamide N-methyase
MPSSDRATDQPEHADLAPWVVTMTRFVYAHTRPTVPRYVPEIALRLGFESVPLWDQIEREFGRRGGPPYWAFAWPGGLALARHLLDTPVLVAGRRVLDLGAGSGVVGIAAAKCGAAHVIANDIDPFAAIALSLNADANGVAVMASADDLLAPDSSFDPAHVDVVLAGDVFYDHALATRAMPFLARCRAAGCTVLIGDPGRVDLPVAHLARIGVHRVPVEEGEQFVTARTDTRLHEMVVATVWMLQS